MTKKEQKNKNEAKYRENQDMPEEKPDTDAEKANSAEDELERLRQENAQLQDKIMRLMAEFDNFRKRQQKILENMIEQERNNIIGRLLEVAGDVDRALSEVESGGNPEAIYEGIKMIARRIRELLRLEGVEVVDPIGKPFDPLEHEAISVKPVHDQDLDNVVVEVFQPAYKREGKLIAPAKVAVGQYTPKPNSEEGENDQR